MSRRARGIAALLLVALVGGSLLAANRLSPPPLAYALVDESTLVVLKGQVDVQRANGTATTVTADTPVRVGDRLRTGAGSYASVTYFDGSSTHLDPETEIVIERLDRAPSGGQHAISFRQESGATWNRVERMVDATIRFETTTAAAKISAGGTEYKVRVEANGRTIVEAVTDSVTVEAAGGTVVLQPGFTTSIEPGQRPSAPVRTSVPAMQLRITLEGPGLLFITDDQNRSVGFHPQVDAFGSQIPGATFEVGNGRQTIDVPSPVETYALRVTGRPPGGRYSLSMSLLLNGQVVTSPDATIAANGLVTGGQLQGTTLHIRDQRLRVEAPVGEVKGPAPGTRVAFARGQVGTFGDVIARAMGTSRSGVEGGPESATPLIGQGRVGAGPGTTPSAATAMPPTGALTATATPTLAPTASPTPEPSPTLEPTPTPTEEPSPTPTSESTAEPSSTPTISPTEPTTSTPAPTLPPPTPTPAPTRLPAAPPPPETPEGQLFRLINQTRAESGRPALTWDPSLAMTARAHNDDMLRRNYFDHISLEGDGPAERMLEAGVPGFPPRGVWGENLSIDRSVATAHLEDLKEPTDEPGNHHANILDGRFTRVGISVGSRPDGALLIGVLFIP